MPEDHGYSFTDLSDFTDEILTEMKAALVDRRPRYGDFEEQCEVWWRMRQAMARGRLEPLVAGDPALSAGMEHLLLKMSRLAAGPTHEDSWLDAAAYCVLSLAVIRRRRKAELAGGPQPAITALFGGKA